MMDIQQQSNPQLEMELDMAPLTLRTDKKITLNQQAQNMVQQLTQTITQKPILNRNIDSSNTTKMQYPLMVKHCPQGQFKNFMSKGKHLEERKDYFEILRDQAQKNDIKLQGRVKNKMAKSKMIVRVVVKEENTMGVVAVEDQTGREKMVIKTGILWVGMFCCVDCVWIDGAYHLEKIIDLGQHIPIPEKSIIKTPLSCFKMLMLKAPFYPSKSTQPVGLKLLTTELNNLRKNGEKISLIVIMGPLLPINNASFCEPIFAQKTIEEEFMDLIKLTKDEIRKIFSQVDIIFIPSTEDITNYYPIPQPKYEIKSKDINDKKVHFCGNPSSILLDSGKKSYKMDFVNLDILRYIDETKTGRATTEILQENLETYQKQPFIVHNTLEEPFDETNLGNLYNGCNYGDFVIFSSTFSPPFARKIKGKIMINIGSLGMQANLTSKHYMTLVNLYDGEGGIEDRVKVQQICM